MIFRYVSKRLLTFSCKDRIVKLISYMGWRVGAHAQCPSPICIISPYRVIVIKKYVEESYLSKDMVLFILEVSWEKFLMQ